MATETPRLITIMGSGEATATMVPVHRAVLDRFPGRPRVAVLDTPYGFQENADELTARLVDYFRTSLPMARVEVASLRSDREPAPARERALEALRRADVVFSGPGSPSYALRIWANTPVPGILAGKAVSGGALTLASAAAITLGRFALPVYEIYKVGAAPFWLDGLDVLARLGIPAAVVPHWNNAEGGTHDTSRCWLGARRFGALAARLPAGAAIVGVDEHTSCTLDPDAGRLRVAGKGTVTLLVEGEEAVLGPGDEAPLSVLRRRPAGDAAAPEAPGAPAGLAAFEEAFAAAVGAGDGEAALDAILSLEDAHQSWAPADAAAAHDALRAMATRFAGALARPAPDEPGRAAAIDALLRVRARARGEGRWEDADSIRRALHLLAVEVRDTPQGTAWGTVGR